MDLQQFLDQFTQGSDTIKNAVIMVEKDGKLHEIKRMEVHENSQPIIGFKAGGTGIPVIKKLKEKEDFHHIKLPSITTTQRIVSSW